MTRETPAQGQRSTRDAAEIARFEAMARDWWDPKGPMRVLHKFNPVRLAWIRDVACRHFGRDAQGARPLADLRIVDVGCGGGVLSVPLARLGATVTGLDPATTNIEVARLQAEGFGLEIDFRCGTLEETVAAGETFDVVLAMEVVEHVADIDAFVEACAKAVRPGGLLVMATINRTMKSFALAIVGAEYVLGWLPRGTHNWEKFVTPRELAQAIARHGLDVEDEAGVAYHPLRDQWSLARDTDVNYMLSATRAG
jgi:2-polyprenyl-6-hydroxyphenyl methylase/3-demethylubiquinone-9 3-methyltransferase